MTYFIKSGTSFKPADERNLDIHEALPVGNYVIKMDPFENLYFDQIDSFEFKGKLYGDNVRNTERIFSTFMDRSVSTGVMLAGEKGSGKSLLAKSLAIRAAKDGIPTIVINSAWCGDKFNQFIQDIEQPAVILFDEFEKVYDRDEQEQILTLLDGVFPSKKLFILTCNDKYRIDTHMRNRPGRIYYMLDFKGLEASFIEEYCQDNLINKSHIDKVCKIATVFNEFNFDMLKALVEEMNRYGETPQDAMRMLNAKPEFEERAKFDVHLMTKGMEVPKTQLEYSEWHGNPLQRPLAFDYDPEPNNSDADWITCSFTQSDLKELDPQGGKFVFVNAAGDALTLTRVREKMFNYFEAF